MLMEYTMAEMPHRWNRCAGTHFDDEGALRAGQLLLQARFLLSTAPIDPSGIVEHQDVRSCHPAAARADGWKVTKTAVLLIDVWHEVVGSPNVCAAGFQTL